MLSWLPVWHILFLRSSFFFKCEYHGVPLLWAREEKWCALTGSQKWLFEAFLFSQCCGLLCSMRIIHEGNHCLSYLPQRKCGLWIWSVEAHIYQSTIKPGQYNRLPRELSGLKKKFLLPVQKTWVWSQGWKDPLEEEMATHSSILAWDIPWTEKPGGWQSIVLQRVVCDWATEHARIIQHKFTFKDISNSQIPSCY